MKKYADVILLALFLIISCKEHGGTSTAKEPPDNGPETQITSCSGNENCKSGEICKDSVCISETITIACSHDSECQAGQYCSNGSCVAKEAPLVACASDTDCSSGLKCDNGTCVIPPLTCNASETLVDGACKTNGNANSSCKESGLCNPGLACSADNKCLGTGKWTHLGKTMPFPAMATGAVAKRGNITYIGTESGVFKTSDGGATWAPSNNGLPGATAVQTLISVGQNMYAGLAGEGVYVTSDGGLNWSALNSGLTTLWGKYVMSLLKVPTKSGLLYAGTLEGVFSISVTNPTEWKSAGLEDLQINHLAYYNSNLYASTLYDDKGVFVRVADGGWLPQNSGLEIPDTNKFKTIYSMKVSAPFGLIAALEDGIYQLNFNMAKLGPKWIPIYEGTPAASLTVIGDEIYVLESNKLFKYSGGKWLPIGIEGSGTIWSITPVDGNIFLIADKAIYKTAAGNIDWQSIDYDLAYDSVRDILSANNFMVAGTDKRYLAYSNDGGSSWSYLESEKKYSRIVGIKQNNNTIYAATDSGYFFESENGVDWQLSNDGPEFGTHIYDFMFFDNSIFVAAAGKVLKYENFTEWKNLNFIGSEVYSLAAFNGEIYAGTMEGLYKFTNGNWSLNALESSWVTALFPYENYLYAGTFSGLYQLSAVDDVASLVSEPVKLEGHIVIDIKTFKDDIYAATSFGLYKTPKGSSEWTRVSELADIGAVTAIFATKDMLYIGTPGSGVYIYAP